MAHLRRLLRRTAVHDPDEGTHSVGTFGAALTPSYRAGSLVWFRARSTARQHPTIKEKGVEGALDFSADVSSGPFNLVLSAGVEIDLAYHVKGSVVLYQDLTQDPVSYGPSLGAMVIVPLGTRHRAPAPSAVPAAGPAPAPAPAPGPAQGPP